VQEWNTSSSEVQLVDLSDLSAGHWVTGLDIQIHGLFKIRAVQTFSASKSLIMRDKGAVQIIAVP
jgi:hypothetical protein